MSTLPRTYRHLATVEDAAVDEALAAAARELDGPYLRFAAEVLLQRARPDGLPAVVECYHRLPADLKQQVLAAVAAIAPVLRGSVRSYDLQTRLNCLEIASCIGGESLAYLFDLGLMDSEPKVRELAASMTRQMAGKLLADHPLLRADAATAAVPLPTVGASPNEVDPAVRLAQRRQQLFEALLSGTQRYESHLRAEVVEACMWFEPYLGDRFWALLEQSRSKLPRLVADLLISSDEPPAACFLLQAMADPQMRPNALRAITERRDPKWFRAVLRGAALWHPWPRVRRSWSYIKDIAFLCTLDDAGWAALGNEASLPILITATNIGMERKAMLLERLLKGAPSPACRRQILLEACRVKEWGPPLLQIVLNNSTDPAEVRMAAYGLLQAGYEGLASDLARRLSTPGDTAAADLVGLAADLIFWRLWTRFDAMQEERRVATLMGIKGFAGYLKDRLRVNMASTSVSIRVRAVRMTGLLGLVDPLWRDMLAAARDPASRVRSAAVRFLGRSTQPSLHEQLRAALDDQDGRVQANAIEAIDEAGWPDRLRLVVTKLHSDNNRVRGSAAKALVRAGHDEASQVLAEMLEDDRADYRITALWSIKQIGVDPWAQRLADLAEHDPSAAVRRYAHSVYKDLQLAAEPAADEE